MRLCNWVVFNVCFVGRTIVGLECSIKDDVGYSDDEWVLLSLTIEEGRENALVVNQYLV